MQDPIMLSQKLNKYAWDSLLLSKFKYLLWKQVKLLIMEAQI